MREGSPHLLRGQEALLRDLLNKSHNGGVGYGSYARRGRSGATMATIKLCTVDRFQGHEAEVVFLSFVKTRSVKLLAKPQPAQCRGHLCSLSACAGRSAAVLQQPAA